MTNRFRLRFVSGERSGETVPLPAAGLLVGRRPESGLAIADSSVSGKHAELRVDDRGVVVEDLGSTNGTRVGGARIDSPTPLAHGDELRFGNVGLVFEDADIGGTEAPAAAATGAAEEVHRVDVSRGAKRSKRPIVVLALLVVVAGAAVWVNRTRNAGGGGASGPRVLPVVPVAGNLLESSYSFETPAALGVWESVAAAPAALAEGAAWRRSGERGLGAELEAGGWAESRSGWVRAPVDRRVTVAAAVVARDDVELRLGLEFRASADDAIGAPFWSAPLDAGAGDGVFGVDVPAGQTEVRVRLLARSAGGGAGGFDDVRLTTGGAAGESVASNAYELRVPGDAPTTALFTRVDQVLLANLRAYDGDALPAGSPRVGTARLAASAADSGLRLQIDGGATTLAFAVPARLAREGIATTGRDGYQRHTDEFEAVGVESLLIGADLSLIRLGLPQASPVRGRPIPGGFEIEADVLSGTVDVQLDFGTERVEAARLGREAGAAERAGAYGRTIALWTELLDRYPYDSALVRAAEEGRVRLIEAGLERVRDAERQVERARFFDLVDLYGQCRANASEVAATWAGTEVEVAALALVDEIDAQVAALDTGRSEREGERLRAILDVLSEDEESSALAEQVRQYMEVHYPEALFGDAEGADAGADTEGGA